MRWSCGLTIGTFFFEVNLAGSADITYWTFFRLRADTTCGKPLISFVEGGEEGEMHCKDLFLLIFGGKHFAMLQKEI
jgi:hypothetical protein